MTTKRTPHRTLLVLLGSLALLPAAAPAQCHPELAENITLSQADKDKVRQCVESNKAGLTGDPNQIKQARRAIGGVFDAPGNISVSFRIELARALIPVLTPLVADPRDLVAANSLQLAGEVGTSDSIALLARGLADPRPAVRYGAAYGYKRLFDQLRSSAPAFQRSDALAACAAVAAAIAAEKEAHVLEGYARALESAALVPAEKEQVVGLRGAAVAAVAKEFGARLRAKDAGLDVVPAVIRAGQVLRDAVNKINVPPNEPPLADPLPKEIAGFGGDLLAFAKRRVAVGNLAAADRTSLANVADVGYGVYYFAASAMQVKPAADESIGALVRAENDKEFLAKVDKFIGADGALAKPPFAFPADRFK